MEGLKPEVVAILQYLFPGLLAACVFYLLTAFRRPEPLERIIQALIFTGVIQALVFFERWAALTVGKYLTLGSWTEAVATGWSTVTAVLVGMIAVRWTTDDWLFRRLRARHLTKQMAYPTEWFGSLVEHGWYVVLHLKDGLRLYGWPEEWPSSAHTGHFRMVRAKWLKTEDESSEEIELPMTQAMLINVDDVRWVELLAKTDDSDDSQASNTATT